MDGDQLTLCADTSFSKILSEPNLIITSMSSAMFFALYFSILLAAIQPCKVFSRALFPILENIHAPDSVSYADISLHTTIPLELSFSFDLDSDMTFIMVPRFLFRVLDF